LQWKIWGGDPKWDGEYDGKNRCCDCGVDMGDCNPRQLCRKTRCDCVFPNRIITQKQITDYTKVDNKHKFVDTYKKFVPRACKVVYIERIVYVERKYERKKDWKQQPITKFFRKKSNKKNSQRKILQYFKVKKRRGDGGDECSMGIRKSSQMKETIRTPIIVRKSKIKSTHTVEKKRKKKKFVKKRKKVKIINESVNFKFQYD